MESSNERDFEDKSLRDLFDEVDDLLSSGKYIEAHILITSCSPLPAERFGWLYRAALTCYNEGFSEDIESNRLHWLRKAHDYALEAHELEPTDVEVLSVLCSATGKLAEDSSMFDKAKYGFKFQKYLNKAIALRADSYEFLHMRGRFQYQVSMLDPVDKKIAKVFGSVPNASLESALEDLLAANNVSADEIENTLYIGKTYDAMGLYENAEIYLKKVLTVSKKPECAVEREYVEEAAKILESKNYLKDS
ncbi:hypothetical protein KIN20_028860 [Parelaphostrongylus tenuis]|uniref:Tetratricopeptide repeat protein n=1 Tax=Parelaphostrongylus tenuis TaxID=148309 RepID=A0AAD5R1Q0_PARTN|nr:hypothetical protein KIN20_028860 [Parelaphostrongylus tenuis]